MVQMRIPIWLTSAAMSAVTFTSTTEPTGTGGGGGLFQGANLNVRFPIAVLATGITFVRSTGAGNRAIRNTIRCPLSKPRYFLFFMSRESRWRPLPLRLCFGREGEGSGRGERGRRRDERGPAAGRRATNAARQPAGAAGPARGEAHQERKAGREVAWLGAVVAVSSAPPVVAHDSRAPTSAAPGFSPPCVY
jgi:hypothetical protein